MREGARFASQKSFDSGTITFNLLRLAGVCSSARASFGVVFFLIPIQAELLCSDNIGSGAVEGGAAATGRFGIVLEIIVLVLPGRILSTN